MAAARRNRGGHCAKAPFLAPLRESRLEQSNGACPPRNPQSLTKKVRTARPNQLTIAAGRKLKIEAVKTSPSKNIKNAMPPTSRIAPIIKAARNATVPSIRSRYGRVVERGMRQNAYETQNIVTRNHTVWINGEPCWPAGPIGAIWGAHCLSGDVLGNFASRGSIASKEICEINKREDLICERWSY
jgi:hypothetical protein